MRHKQSPNVAKADAATEKDTSDPNSQTDTLVTDEAVQKLRHALRLQMLVDGGVGMRKQRVTW